MYFFIKNKDKIKKNYKIILFILFIIILLCVYILLNKSKEYFLNEEESINNIKEISNPIQYKDLLFKNLERGVLTKMEIKPSNVQREDCKEKCGEKDCKIMYEQKRNLDACNACHR